MKTVWVFPGQGSQSKGMGEDLALVGKEKLAVAAEILGWSVLDRCQAELAVLSQTHYTQPCLYVISAILTDFLKAQGEVPDWVAGHSLGEYSALYCAGAFDFETGLSLVKERSLRMGAVQGGKMVALMGFDRDKLEILVADRQDVVIANDNSADQVVISGTEAGVQEVVEVLKAKRSIPLTVSGAFHSPLMQEISVEFGAILRRATFQELSIPMLSNVAPTEPTTSGKVCQERLLHQMTAPVRWREICLHFLCLGVDRVVEVGPGKVLTGLVKRIAPGIELVNVSTLAQGGGSGNMES